MTGMNTRRLLSVPIAALVLGACASRVATETSATAVAVSTAVPDTSTATATTSPEATEPETTEPETTAPETTEPETTAPETTAPETTASAASTALAGVPATGDVVQRTLVTADGRTRVYRIYVPSSLPNSPVPLLLAFHGGTGWGAQFEKNSGFDELAEANGFLVVYPDGVGSGADETTNRTWNGGDCCGAAARNDVDDVAFVDQLLDVLEAAYSIDPARVFAAGHSNGGILSYRLACELSERIMAVGLQAGTLEIDACAPPTAVSLLHIHGVADTNLPIDGGRGTTSIANVDFNSPRVAVQTFADAIGCSAEPAVTTTATNADLTVSTWTGCDDRAEVQFVAVDGAAHPWMGHTPSNPAAPPVYTGLDASFEIVAFLLAHPR